MKVRAEIKVMILPTKEFQEPEESIRDKERCPLEPPKGVAPDDTLTWDFLPPKL